MAVTISAADLGAAAQLAGDQATRLLPVVTALVEQYAPDAPEAIQNEAAVRCAGWLGHTACGQHRQGGDGTTKH